MGQSYLSQVIAIKTEIREMINDAVDKAIPEEITIHHNGGFWVTAGNSDLIFQDANTNYEITNGHHTSLSSCFVSEYERQAVYDRVKDKYEKCLYEKILNALKTPKKEKKKC